MYAGLTDVNSCEGIAALANWLRELLRTIAIRRLARAGSLNPNAVA
jgi:hypothetical protein